MVERSAAGTWRAESSLYPHASHTQTVLGKQRRRAASHGGSGCGCVACERASSLLLGVVLSAARSLVEAYGIMTASVTD